MNTKIRASVPYLGLEHSIAIMCLAIVACGHSPDGSETTGAIAQGCANVESAPAASAPDRIRFVHPEDMPFESAFGVQERLLANKSTGSRVEFMHAIIPEVGGSKGISYPGHEEHVWTMRGEAEVTVDGEKTVVGPGSYYFVPDGVVHDFEVIKAPYEAVGVFSPPRN